MRPTTATRKAEAPTELMPQPQITASIRSPQYLLKVNASSTSWQQGTRRRAKSLKYTPYSPPTRAARPATCTEPLNSLRRPKQNLHQSCSSAPPAEAFRATKGLAQAPWLSCRQQTPSACRRTPPKDSNEAALRCSAHDVFTPLIGSTRRFRRQTTHDQVGCYGSAQY